MLFKLSLKNIRKSLKDYSIYFLTLVFAIAMFYMFNSIDAQSSMMILNDSKRDIVKSLVFILGYVSVFVSFILGFLIVYANNFLIKRRKKEIGLYFTLGMSKRKVSLILFLETVFIGIISLIVGLLFGIFLSQFLSVLTAKMFEVDMSNYKFIFSISAFRKTILYFSIIYVVVIILNTFTLSRYKLINLLNANRKNERIKVRNKYFIAVVFALSLFLLGYAYYLLFHNALVMMNKDTVIMLIFGALGTFFFFYSLSGFLLSILKRSKNIYYHKLNTFILRQVNSHINTTVISISIICLMLLLTIGCLSGSMSLASVLNGDLADNNLTDFTARAYNSYVYDDGKMIPSESTFNNFEELITNSNLSQYVKEAVLLHKYYVNSLAIEDIMTEKDRQKIIDKYGSNVSLDYLVPIIRESEYQKLMTIQGQKYVDIADNEYLLLCNIDFIIDSYTDYYQSSQGIMINDSQLIPATKNIIKTAIENYSTAGNDGVIVVSDKLVQGLSQSEVALIGNFIDTDNIEKIENDFESYLTYTVHLNYDYRTRTKMEATSVGLKTMIIFLGLYLGITFAISSATVLAIGQLSESSDNRDRYHVLKQLGADNKMINKALFIQIAITFAFPLIIALVHSYFGLREVNNLLISIGNVDLTSNLLLTTLFMIIVYGGYFLITYICSKSIIKD